MPRTPSRASPRRTRARSESRAGRALSRCDRKRACADVGAEPPARGSSLGKQRQQQAAGAGADVENADRTRAAIPPRRRARAPPRSASRCPGADRASPARSRTCGRRKSRRPRMRDTGSRARAAVARSRRGASDLRRGRAAARARARDPARAANEARRPSSRAVAAGVLDASARELGRELAPRGCRTESRAGAQTAVRRSHRTSMAASSLAWCSVTSASISLVERRALQDRARACAG